MGLDNEALVKRLEKIENIFIDIIKSDVSFNNQLVKDDIVNSIKISENDLVEIQNIKNDKDSLFYYLMKLKNENNTLQKEMENLTIECNKILRSSKPSTD